MGNPLRQRRTPQEFAAERQVIEINSKISDFERLSAAIARDLDALHADEVPRDWRDAEVTGTLSFGFAAAQGNMPSVAGQAAAGIVAVCQRCLQPFSMPLRTKLRLVFGEDGDEWPAGGDAEGYEYWESQGGELCPADLVDEALIMALPFAAMHDAADCAVKAAVAKAGPEKMTTPFANLKAQMGKEN